MKNYMKPEMEICVIEEEDVLMDSGLTFPSETDFPDEPGTQKNQQGDL